MFTFKCVCLFYYLLKLFTWIMGLSVNWFLVGGFPFAFLDMNLVDASWILLEFVLYVLLWVGDVWCLAGFRSFVFGWTCFVGVLFVGEFGCLLFVFFDCLIVSLYTVCFYLVFAWLVSCLRLVILIVLFCWVVVLWLLIWLFCFELLVIKLCWFWLCLTVDYSDW